MFNFFLLKLVIHHLWLTLGPQDLEFRASAEAAERSERGRLAAAAQTLAAGGAAWLQIMSLCLCFLLDLRSLFSPKVWRFSSDVNFGGDPKSE